VLFLPDAATTIDLGPLGNTQENTMPKGQRSTKEAKKPKKDQSPAKPLSPGAVMPTITTIIPERGKKKK
jgi:hypothetical protein